MPTLRVVGADRGVDVRGYLEGDVGEGGRTSDVVCVLGPDIKYEACALRRGETSAQNWILGIGHASLTRAPMIAKSQL